MPGNLVLVTGVTGFIAGQVVESLLKAGYRVRGTARGSKADVLINTVHVPGLEFVRVDDIATSDLDAVLEDVHAAIHVASPLPGHASMEETLSTAIDGTLNVLRKGSHRGIKKFVITSTFGTLVDPLLVDGFSDRTLSETGPSLTLLSIP
ncbi:hypothetical protein CC1G_05862 [Coprinopsis cinerea okayama7|uniref:NAD-dependent epimerase/dehydratase domain-containing protein n=1 Tax=Coprinopsis cinerea (strain Okayama-7 / 130 / ATCC MYA-4618 / FGSC 9003) TaxID=240176 RepID=A8NLM2_COPC7|nr:hypothetical protein CC1G_05862 [Coprinopsis cinerea okayama7\|eukprot:XP_001834725.2 hypothetical protein CC1G_05862 [Coprinopsis cinerea okayama7\